MKKFKVIEESRFLNNWNMADIKGGQNCGITTSFITPDCAPWISCTPSVAEGYFPFCNNRASTCGMGTTYKVINKDLCPEGRGWYSLTCGGTQRYFL